MELKRTKKLLSVVLALMITASAAPLQEVLPMFGNTAITAEAADTAILYVSRWWNGSQVVSKVETCSDPAAIVSTSTTLKSGWYIVNKNVTISSRIIVTGDVHLILCDGCTLKAKEGITVNDGNSLTIYSGVKGTGKLYAGTDGSSYTCKGDHAGIGGSNSAKFGNMTFNGGTIYAVGCAWSAGIGGATNTYSGGTITFNGGEVHAYNSKRSAGAAIGSGSAGNGKGSVVINGGTVQACVHHYDYQGLPKNIGRGCDHNSSCDVTLTVKGNMKMTKGSTSFCNETYTFEQYSQRVATVITSLPTASEITYGQSLSESTLSGGIANNEGKFVWSNPNIKPTVSDSNSTEYDVTFIPDDKGDQSVTCKVQLKVNPKTVTPTVTINKTPTYSGAPLEPSVTVKDGNTLIPNTEYSVSYSNNINAGTDIATATVKDVEGGNYILNEVSKKFSISKAGIPVVSVNAPTLANLTYIATSQTLLKAGSVIGNIGEIYYKLGTKGTWSTTVPSATDAGTYTVYWYVKGDSNHNDLGSETYPYGTINNAKINTASMNAEAIGYSDIYDGKEHGITLKVTSPTGASVYYSSDQTKWSKDPITYKDFTNGAQTVYYKVEAPNYKTVTGSATVNITKKDVTITGLSASNKEYDGTTKATVTGTAFINGKVGNDDVTVSAGSAAFADVNVGTDKNVTFSGYSLSGSAAGNYELSAQPANTKATIYPKSVTITGLSASNKEYDGTTKVTVTGTPIIDGKVGNDDVSVSAGSAAFENANAGRDKAVAFSGYSLSGEKAGNYQLSAQPQSVKADITTAPLTITAKPQTITYGDAPTNDGVTYSGFVNNETSDVLGGTLAYAYNYSQYENVGSDYTITPSGLTSNNYTITYNPGTLTVNPKQVGILWENTALTYSGSAQAPTATADGLVNEDDCTIEVSGAQIDAGTGYTAEAVSLSNQNYALPSEETDRQTTFSIDEATIETIVPPKALNPTRSSGSVKLIQSGSAENGTMYYSIGTEESAGDTWETDANKITANKAGTYFVWYKVIGNKNYADVQPQMITVKVKNAPSFYSQSWTLSMESYTFDGTAHKPEFIGDAHGEITYTYYNADTDEKLDSAPIEPGNYRVKVFAEGGTKYFGRTQEASYSILSAFDENGMADVAAFKKNNIIPKADGKVFAGWFKDSTCTKPYTGKTGKAYAKFIDEKVLTVKAQLTSGTTASSTSTSIRFITSLDSLKYQNIGFKITFNGKTLNQKLTMVYSALLANGKRVNPSVFSEESHYMGAFTLNNIPKSVFDKEFTVTPYYTTEDGTVVEGKTSTFIIANMIK